VSPSFAAFTAPWIWEKHPGCFPTHRLLASAGWVATPATAQMNAPHRLVLASRLIAKPSFPRGVVSVRTRSSKTTRGAR
jgi:hypothetical protein